MAGRPQRGAEAAPWAGIDLATHSGFADTPSRLDTFSTADGPNYLDLSRFALQVVEEERVPYRRKKR